MDTASQVAAVDRYVTAFATRSTDLIREIYASDATLEDPVGSEVRVGIDAIVEFYTNAFEMNVTLELLGKPRCAGNAVAFPFQVNAGGMKIEAIDVFEFNADGKVASMKAYWGTDNVVT
jgi:steroid delta-isomerase